MRILALDLGAKMGWALWDNGCVTSGVWSLNQASSKRFEGGGMKFVRFVRMLNEMPPLDRVAFEEVRRHLGVDAAHAYGGYLSQLSSWCETQSVPVPYEGISVSAIKKRATGKGNASKEEMIQAAKDKLGKMPEDDNEADALWLLMLACEAEKLSWAGSKG